MLRIKRPMVTAEQTVALDESGGVLILSLSDDEGHEFRRALNAHDAGVLLELLDLGGIAAGSGTEYIFEVKREVMYERNLCQGDLVAKKIFVDGDHEGLHFAWHDERGGDGLVCIDRPGEMIFEEALRSYCRMLMRSSKFCRERNEI